jgi:Mce-associated membrane protein
MSLTTRPVSLLSDPQTTVDSLQATDTLGDSAVDRADPVGGELVPERRFGWPRAVAFGVLPGLAVLLAISAGFVKWQDSLARHAEVAAAESVQAARDGTVALLSYRPDSVDKDLGDARQHLTGAFRDSYTSLTNDVVIPGAKQKQVSSVATVPATASVSASENRAVVMLFVNQRTIVGNDAPTLTASTIKVTLEKNAGRWLISEFDPA